MFKRQTADSLRQESAHGVQLPEYHSGYAEGCKLIMQAKPPECQFKPLVGNDSNFRRCRTAARSAEEVAGYPTFALSTWWDHQRGFDPVDM